MSSINIDGTLYEFPSTLVYADHQILKRVGGVTASEVDVALTRMDMTVVAALALICLRHAGKRVNERAWLEAKHTMEFEDPEESDPPTDGEENPSPETTPEA